MQHFDDPLEYNFQLWNNSDYSKSWGIVDRQTGVSLLESEQSVQILLKASQSLSAAALLTLTQQADNTVSGIVFDTNSPATGNIQVTFRKSDIESISPGLYFYNLKITFPDGLIITYIQGMITLNAGVGL